MDSTVYLALLWNFSVYSPPPQIYILYLINGIFPRGLLFFSHDCWSLLKNPYLFIVQHIWIRLEMQMTQWCVQQKIYLYCSNLSHSSQFQYWGLLQFYHFFYVTEICNTSKLNNKWKWSIIYSCMYSLAKELNWNGCPNQKPHKTPTNVVAWSGEA